MTGLAVPAAMVDAPLIEAVMSFPMVLVVRDASNATPPATPMPAAMLTISAPDEAVTETSDPVDVTVEFVTVALIVFAISFSEAAALPAARPAPPMLPAKERMLAVVAGDALPLLARAFVSSVTTAAGTSIVCM